MSNLEPSEVPEWKKRIYGHAITGDKRRAPTKRQKAALIEKQRNRCLYCEHVIGTVVERRGKPVILRPNYDHFVPFAYSRRNPRDGFALACHLCNGIKSCKIFTTIMEAQEFIRARRTKLGYIVLDLVIPDA
jgi:hypothetical protein